MSVFRRGFIAMNCRKGEVPTVAQNSSYVGEDGEKRGAPSTSSSATWSA